MAIDIFNPPQGGPWGPGIPYQIRDINRPEPLTPPGHWEVTAWDLTLTNTPIVRQVHRFTSPFPEQAVGTIGDLAIEHTYLPAARTLTLDGAPVELRARLIDQNGAHLVEEKTQPMVWDASYAWMLPSAAIQGGFTPSDRLLVQQTQAAVTMSLPAEPTGIAELLYGLADLVRSPPRSILREAEAQLLTGRGSLSPAAGTGQRFRYGATWSWFSVPPGFGKLDGVLDTYYNRMVQLMVLREGADDNLYVDEIVASSQAEGTLLWSAPVPTSINYDIAPGLQVTWTWLTR